jgi:uncharacterized membrane protein YiaA
MIYTTEQLVVALLALLVGLILYLAILYTVAPILEKRFREKLRQEQRKKNGL